MMNLNSLLNGNPNAVDQPKEGGQENFMNIQSRNRTPWDAGGYSFRFYNNNNNNNAPIKPAAVLQHMAYEIEKHPSTQTSPRHSYSDSRSSLFSLPSAIDSSPHSRISSVSTTIEGLPSKAPAANVSESPSPKSATKFFSADATTETSRNNINHIYSGGPIQHNSRKDIEAMNDSARRASERGINFNRYVMTPIKEKEALSARTLEEMRRPSSPSDAMLIKRQQTTLCLRMARENSDSKSFCAPKLDTSNMGINAKAPKRGMPHFISHKRAYSAPNFYTPSHQATMANPNKIMSSIELTPPSSIHPDYPSPKMSSMYQTPATPPQIPSEIESQTIKCMYVSDCDTGSQLRKAISHIFGRNKICTRQIPSRVWVHYCRKHYQRSRYRNPKEYAKLQCDLVQQQIRRVHDWSETNAAAGKAGVVQDWTISVRKREQKRLDDIQNNRKRKSGLSDREEEEEEEFNIDVNCKNSSSAVPATAVPVWLLEHCRKGYSTLEILEIFNRLHQEILGDCISTFPDIEILPNISIEQEEKWSPNGCMKRPPNNYHKRAKSLTVGLSSICESGDRRSIQPLNSNPEAFHTMSPQRQQSRSSIMSTPDSTYQPFPWSLSSDWNRRSSAVALQSRIEGNQIPEYYETFSPLCKQSLQPAFTPHQNMNQDQNYHNDLGNMYPNYLI
ncbi:putative orp1 like protein [Erysiphe neolycopersici]|uniref:Putative orp1 like protein n=1 Tax=Erysiphe neolycopersici TaxID=212602 RepID=A0A420HXF3_9PEZI|nr:putative orp1 like protein [Erysiphe neolycopersici]